MRCPYKNSINCTHRCAIRAGRSIHNPCCYKVEDCPILAQSKSLALDVHFPDKVSLDKLKMVQAAISNSDTNINLNYKKVYGVEE